MSKINVVFLSGFKVKETGILSTALGLTSAFRGACNFFTNTSEKIDAVDLNPIDSLPRSEGGKTIFFSNLDYVRLPLFVRSFKPKLVHVGDWPLSFRLSEFRYKRDLRSLVKLIATFAILVVALILTKKTKYIFVNSKEFIYAKKFGFVNAIYIPIGVNLPTVALRKSLDLNTVCFTGNFNYLPNYYAAQSLIDALAGRNDVRLVFIGFNAEKLYEISSQIECLANVHSVIDELAKMRPIYISCIKFGSGSKNKILEAMVSGCPIIATKESLDPSINGLDSIFIYTYQDIHQSGLLDQIKRIRTLENDLLKVTSEVAEVTRSDRSWETLSINLHSMFLNG